MQQISTEIVQDYGRLGRKNDSFWILQEIEFWPYVLMVYAQTKMRPGKLDKLNPLGFWDSNESLNPSQETRSSAL